MLSIIIIAVYAGEDAGNVLYYGMSGIGMWACPGFVTHAVDVNIDAIYSSAVLSRI